MVGRESDKIVLRVPDGMRERIKAMAMDNNRSMNAEIVATLEKEYPEPKCSREVLDFIDSIKLSEDERSPEEIAKGLLDLISKTMVHGRDY